MTAREKAREALLRQVRERGIGSFGRLPSAEVPLLRRARPPVPSVPEETDHA